MIISEELRKNNIAEYILYMWQTEDLLRSMNFDINIIKTEIINKYDVDDELKTSILNWYSGLIKMAELENIKESGHLQVIQNLVNDLYDLHLWLLNNNSELKYKQAYQLANPHINLLAGKMKASSSTNEIDICLHGLYALMLLNLQKKEITKDTNIAMDTFKKLIGLLASKYHDREKKPEKYYK